MPQLNRGIILYFMREALGQFLKKPSDHSDTYSLITTRTRDRLVNAGLIDPSPDTHQNNPSLAILLTEGYYQLIALGYIVPQLNASGHDPTRFAVTDIGRQWASGGDPVPEDQQGFLAALKLVPNLDLVIRQYVQEALLTYERGALFASAVMIGAASEKAVYLLMDALHGALLDPQKKRAVQKAIDERKLPTMFNRLIEGIKQAKTSGAMPYTVHEGAEHHLLSLQEAIRVQRNDAVHPQVGQVTLETVRLSLAAFPAACRKIYDLMKWFANNQF